MKRVLAWGAVAGALLALAAFAAQLVLRRQGIGPLSREPEMPPPPEPPRPMHITFETTAPESVLPVVGEAPAPESIPPMESGMMPGEETAGEPEAAAEPAAVQVERGQELLETVLEGGETAFEAPAAEAAPPMESGMMPGEETVGEPEAPAEPAQVQVERGQELLETVLEGGETAFEAPAVEAVPPMESGMMPGEETAGEPEVPADPAEAQVERGQELLEEVLTQQPGVAGEAGGEPMAGMQTESGVVLPDEALAMDRDEGMPAPAEATAEPMGPADMPPPPAEGMPGEAVAANEQAPVATAERAPWGETPATEPAAAAPATEIPEAARQRSADAYLDEGNVYFNVGQYGLAIDRYTKAIELDPSVVAGYYNRANARTRAGEFDGALADYDRALELQPNDADALNNRGMLHLYRGSYQPALRDFEAALVADPSDTTVMVNRGLAYLHSGDGERALTDFQQAARLDPRDAAAQYGAAQASAALGRREEALGYVEAALKLDPAYAREAAGDPRLALLEGDPRFLKLLREAR